MGGMKIKLEHPSILKCSQECIEDVIGKSRTISAFCGKINKIANIIAETDPLLINPFYIPTYSEKEKNIMVGHILKQ